MKSALAHFQTLPLKDAARQLHHAFQEGKIQPFITHPSNFILFTMLGSTLSNDPLPDKRFDFPFVKPPCGYEWSKDFDAVTTEAARGFDGRFGAGLPRKSDGQMLFLQHFIHHLSCPPVADSVHLNVRMSSNHSSEGQIRRSLIEADLADCIVALPGQHFYSTQVAFTHTIFSLN